MKKIIGVILGGSIILNGIVFTSSYNQTKEELKELERDIEIKIEEVEIWDSLNIL